jgi:hypothetical protein
MAMWGGNPVNFVDPLGLYGCPDCHAQDIQNGLDALDRILNPTPYEAKSFPKITPEEA